MMSKSVKKKDVELIEKNAIVLLFGKRG